MAFLPNDELDYLLRSKAFARHNSRTIISASALRRELMQVRHSGYALDNEEDEPGVCCIGAPVFDENGEGGGSHQCGGNNEPNWN